MTGLSTTLLEIGGLVAHRRGVERLAAVCIVRMMRDELTMQADCVGIVLGPLEKICVCVAHLFSRICALFGEEVSRRCSRQQERRGYEKAEGLNCYPKPG